MSEIKRPRHPDRLARLANEYGTPTYVYSESVIRRQIASLKSCFEDLPVRLSYAAKANACLFVLQTMVEEGLGIDAVSPAEVELALRCGFERDRILFSANNMTDAEMRFAVDRGVVLNIGELSRLERFGASHPGSSLCVRLNPGLGAGHHRHVVTGGDKSKFGISTEHLDDILSIVDRFDLNLVGVHQHIGSGIVDADVLRRSVQVLLDTALRIDTLDFINLGGGLGIAYGPGEASLDLVAWRKKVVGQLRDYLTVHPAGDRLSFEFEPGRYLVAEAGVLLVRVNTLKEEAGRVYAGVDSGMGHLLRPALYGAYHGVFNLSNPDGRAGTYDIVGNICESADFFARNRSVQEIREGDILAILDTGAYGMSMASLYNLRPLPAEVWIAAGGEGRVISPRESPEAFIDRIYPSLAGAVD